MKRSLAMAALLSAAALAQPVTPPKQRLEYTGHPLKILFECRNDDIVTAGLTCSVDDPCPVYLELTAVESVGNRVLVTGNVHTEASTISSLLLMSEDGGHSWVEPFQRIPFAVLDQIQFVDFEAGWISGQIVQGTPRDPFFLITGDGGKTWRRKPLWEDSRSGSIEQFWFDSRSNGSLFVDRIQTPENGGRYERYESQTGGESWTVRQLSMKPLPLARHASADPAFRTRPDRATNSYRIERRESGDRWSTLAAFAIDIGVCKPEPPKETDAAPPDAVPVESKDQNAEPAPPPVPRPRTPPTLKKKP